MRDDNLDWFLGFHRRRYWLSNGWSLRFRAILVNANNARPFGIKYSLTLHDVDGLRLLGFDNAHWIPKVDAYDHRHSFRRTKVLTRYEFESGNQLIVDFFDAVEKACSNEGFEFFFDDELLEEVDTTDEEEDADDTQIFG